LSTADVGGSGKPEGTVAEIQEQVDMVIKSKGKEVKKNASDENPVWTIGMG
jgi:hypothetical protein